MKAFVQYILQKLLGFDRYLFLFSKYKIRTIHKDPGEKDFFHFVALLNDSDAVLDIGANIGIMTYHLANKAKKADIKCFEPVPENARALRKIIQHYKLSNVELNEFALGAEEGELEMVLPVVSNVKKQGLSHVVHEDMKDFNEGVRFNVPVKTLDGFLSDYSGRIQAIKMDVENFEYFVLKGGESTLKKHMPIIYCELWDNDNRYRCFDLMTDLGYDIMILDQDKLVKHDSDKHHTQNFFFIPPKS